MKTSFLSYFDVSLKKRRQEETFSPPCTNLRFETSIFQSKCRSSVECFIYNSKVGIFPTKVESRARSIDRARWNIKISSQTFSPDSSKTNQRHVSYLIIRRWINHSSCEQGRNIWNEERTRHPSELSPPRWRNDFLLPRGEGRGELFQLFPRK